MKKTITPVKNPQRTKLLKPVPFCQGRYYNVEVAAFILLLLCSNCGFLQLLIK